MTWRSLDGRPIGWAHPQSKLEPMSREEEDVRRMRDEPINYADVLEDLELTEDDDIPDLGLWLFWAVLGGATLIFVLVLVGVRCAGS
jgi:hypothetical protein